MTDMQLQQGYAHLASLLAPHVDVLCCETLASVREGAIAVRAAATTGMYAMQHNCKKVHTIYKCTKPMHLCTFAPSLGKPVWVAWTLRDDCTATLRSGEPLQAALDAVAGVEGLDAVLVNCCAPQVCATILCLLKSCQCMSCCTPDVVPPLARTLRVSLQLFRRLQHGQQSTAYVVVHTPMGFPQPHRSGLPPRRCRVPRRALSPQWSLCHPSMTPRGWCSQQHMQHMPRSGWRWVPPWWAGVVGVGLT